ncbi:MAG: hypothetical protein U0793_14395 [Gemmataceae bacterium]
MASLKKSKKSGKPSAGLAIALVFFILIAIGAGVWGYYGYKGQDELRAAAKSAEAAKAGEVAAAKYFRFLAMDYAMALGHRLPGEYAKEYPELRKSFFEYHAAPDTSPDFKVLGAPTGKAGAPAAEDKKFVEENAKNLNFNDKTNLYETNVIELRKAADKRVTDAEAGADARADLAKKATASFDSLNKNLTAFWDKTIDEIKKGNAEAIAAAKATYKQMETVLAQNRELNDQILKLTDAKEKEERKLNKKIKDLNDELKTALADRPEGGGAGAAAARGEPNALVLDISGFRPLWDRPLGEVTSVDLAERLVYVRPNRNVDKPFKPGLTFLVFGAGADGGAAGQLKGSLEVVRGSGGSYACRITSFYDIERGEIQLSDPAKLGSIRTSKNALKEGDLIFNMFFDTHVALAGVFDLDGEPAGTPAGLARQLESTIASLKNRGVTVDAYVDPITGEVKGAITARTRFLIRGDDLESAALDAGGKAPAPKEPKEPKDKDGKEMEKKEGAPAEKEEPMGRSYAEAVNLLRRQSVEKGMFIISRANFNTVIGYYPLRHFGETARLVHPPTLLTATTLASGKLGFVARDEPKVEDFKGEWEGGGWELSIAADGKAKANLVTDKGGVPEVRIVPAELSKREGKLVLSVTGATPFDLVASISAGGTAIQLEDPAGKMSPSRVTLRKR